MTIKVTATGWSGSEPEDTDIVLRSDAGLTGTFTTFANEVYQWCADVQIEADMIGKTYDDESDCDYSRWRIKNEQHRTMFVLRWL